MNWKTTLALVVLTAAAGVWLWKGDEWAPRTAPPTAPPDPPALASLEADLSPAALTRIEVEPPGGERLVLVKDAKGWSLSGNWPPRGAEVNELVEALGTLRTRFQPVPLPDDADLLAYGLAETQKPLVVKVETGASKYALTFGEPELKPGDSPFTRPAFVRVGSAKEVLKLGPDVMPILRRPADSYRRRQLFSDVERVRLAGAAPAFPGAPDVAPTTLTLPGPSVAEIRVAGKKPESQETKTDAPKWSESGSFTLKRIAPTPAPSRAEKNAEAAVQPDRLADAWAVESPVRDRPEPGTLRRVLAAVPDLWVEEFVSGPLPTQPFAIAQLLPVPLEPFPVALARIHPKTVPDPRTVLKDPPQTLTVVTAGGRAVTVKIGPVAKVIEREETVTVPPPPGVPAPPRTETRKVPTTYRYAQLEGDAQLFTVPADKLDSLFVEAGDLVDSRIAGFAADEVQRVTVARPGKPPVVLKREKGDPKATTPEKQQDHWVIEQQPNPLPADRERVEEFIRRLADFRGDHSTDLYNADPKSRGLDPAACVSVTLLAREKRPEGEPEAPAREYKLLVGAPDFAAGKLPVQLAGWPRITLVDDRASDAPQTGWLAPKLFPDRLEPLFARDAVAYRSRKLLDTRARLTGLTVTGENGFALKQEKAPNGTDTWKLTAPVAAGADPDAVNTLLKEVDGLQASEFLADAPANPAEYGLDKPRVALSLSFDNGRSYKLEIGRERPGKKHEVFARLDGGAVFALPSLTVDYFTRGPMHMLDGRIFSIPVEKITALEVTRLDSPGESFQLAKDGTNWKLTGPFTAQVPYLSAQPMLTQLGSLQARLYTALPPIDPAKYGFDKPLAKVKLSYAEKSGDAEKPVTKTLVIGAPSTAGNRYAKLDEPDAPVFQLLDAYLAAVQTSPLALLDRSLLSIDPAKIAKVQIIGEKPENAVTLTRDEKDVWKAEGAAFTVDAPVATQLADALAPLSVERLAAYGDAVKWAEFGLEKPEYTITVTLAGEKPTTHKIELGKAAPLGARFVRVDGGKAVGVIPADAVRSLARGKLDFADRTMLAFKPDELLGISRTKGKEELELAPDAGAGWDVLKPTKIKADRPLVEELADALSRLRAERVTAFGKKDEVFKQYGLEPPEAAVTLTIGEKLDRKVLRIGKPVDEKKPDGDRFAAVEGSAPDAAVGVLPAALVNKLLAPPVSFRDRTIARFVDADQLQLERGPRTVVFNKVAGTWKVTKPLTADAEQAALDDLVNELARLRAADWVSEKPTPAELKQFGLENPEATWTVKNGEKVELVLRVGKKTPDGRVYATTGTGGMVALLGVPQTAKALGEYRTRKPWTLDAFQAEEVAVTREGGKGFTLRKSGNAWSDPAAPADAIDPRAVTELLASLTALQVERYAVDAGADLKLFGLEKPEATITVTLRGDAIKGDEKRVLQIGGVVGGTDNKQRYARVVDKDRTDVFVLSATDTERFLRGRAEYVQKK